jgi:hypothetical protein
MIMGVSNRKCSGLSEPRASEAVLDGRIPSLGTVGNSPRLRVEGVGK